MDYTVFNLDKTRGVAGLMPIPADILEKGHGPAWTGYIHVEDVSAMAARIQEEGGKLHKGPIVVPGVICFAVVSDPQGAGFLIATPLTGLDPPPVAPTTLGAISWHELHAADWPSAFAFYEKLFGWTKADAVDMGPMGLYQLFTADGQTAIGGMMTKPAAIPMPYWGFYFTVDAIDAAVERVKAGGGAVLNGPHPVPGGSWIANCRDPQGAHFSLTSGNK
jgi:predicted enzyme related to lactoylglutathione lyase